MKTYVIAMPGNEKLADELATHLSMERLAATVRRFPDGETYVRLDQASGPWSACIVCTLDRPDEKLVALMLLACAARDAGASKVALVAPYLAYMRQDRQFHPGETISALHVARWISTHVDWLLTVDPHLHRISALSRVYGIPTRVVHAAPSMVAWISTNVRQPLLIGPDQESAQWVSEVARLAQAPFIVLSKVRSGDREVEVSVPEIERWREHTPVLVDDIVSTARTMIETIGHLRRAGLVAPVCVVVHPIFAQSAYADLQAAGAAQIVSCDSIVHASNRISLLPAIAAGVQEFLTFAEA